MAKATEMITLENSVKLAVLLGFFYNITTGIDSIKSDILLIKQGSSYEIKQLQYQIDECCNKGESRKRLVYNQSPAIMPHEIELKNE